MTYACASGHSGPVLLLGVNYEPFAPTANHPDVVVGAEVIEISEEYKLRNRYRGSREEYDVHPGHLAPPPEK